jgi:putative toxin-antitoxin system antitoxin component (TIGR02293 family)
MIRKLAQQMPPSTLAGRPTACLTKGLSEQLSPVGIALMVKEGFELGDVRAMIALSVLYSEPQIAVKIVGKAPRSKRHKVGVADANRLNAWQSAVAYQYAVGLERAERVFGTLAHAEDWLSRPCRYLDGLVPVDIFDNPVGFQVVMDYLSRVEMGVYQ